MRKIKLPFIIAVLPIVVATSCSDDNGEDSTPSTVDTKAWTFDANMDTSYKPGDNFFMYCNGGYWANTDLGAYSVKGLFYTEVPEINNVRKQQAFADDARMVKITSDYARFDEDSVAAMSTLKANIANIESITTRDEALTAIAKAISDGYELPFGFEPNSKNGKFTVVFQVNDLSNYTNSNASLLRAVGYSAKEANDIAKNYRSAIKKLTADGVAKAVTMKSLCDNPKMSELIVPLDAMKTRGSTGYTTIDRLMELLGISADDVSINSEQGTNYQQLGELTAEELKGLLTSCVANDIKYVSQKGIDIFNENTGQKYAKWEIATNMENDYMNYIISYAFATKYMTEEIKNRGIATSKELLAALRERIQALDWMSETTKQNAIAKLDNMTINVGYPDHWIEEGLPTLNGKTFYDDVIIIRKAYYDFLKYMIGKDRSEVGFDVLCGMKGGNNLTVANAAYSPFFNSINILPTWLLDPYYNEEASDAYIYAVYGVIGHELTHGFDSKGSLYDEIGNYKNWWTVEDKMAFTERMQSLVNCYNNLELMPDELPNIFADGEKTLAENIADLGGVLVAHDAYVKKLKSEGYYGDELAKQEKKFFQGWAEVWREKYNVDFIQYMRVNDEHSQGKERVNGVMMNIDRWYELYDVQWGDNLYLSPERRTYIW